MKAISTVIASILMLMIVVALGGTTYLYISGIFTGKTATTFEIIDAVNDTVIIRNSGTKPITSFRSVMIDNNDAIYRVSKQDNSLVGYWKMDESSWSNDCNTKSVIDSSGKGNDGKSCPAGTGPTGGATGKFGNAGSFDGVDDIVNAGNASSLNPTSAITVSFWVKLNALGNNVFPVAKWSPSAGLRSWILSIAATNYPQFHIRNSDDTATVTATDGVSTVTAGDFYHLVGTFDGSTVKIYKNGVLTGTTSYAGTIYPSTTDVTIPHESYPVNGVIDEVRIYNRALSEQEVKDHYNIGSQINPGEIAAIKIYNALSKGTHTLRLCTSSMCNTGILTIN